MRSCKVALGFLVIAVGLALVAPHFAERPLGWKPNCHTAWSVNAEPSAHSIEGQAFTGTRIHGQSLAWVPLNNVHSTPMDVAKALAGQDHLWQPLSRKIIKASGGVNGQLIALHAVNVPCRS